ncbi:MAG: DNA helicase UvrD [Fibrobacter sp.]|nr:DNA helicase UvrD [Fibrobacter sp.]
MKFIADFHIHSHYSLATSNMLIPEMLDLWGKKKGIAVIGTGDAVHPGWLNELREKLVAVGNGLYTLKKKYVQSCTGSFGTEKVHFVLTSEISCIYKRDGRVRKVHNIVIAPSFPAIQKIQKALADIGNISTDGRPVIGIDSRDLLEIVLSADENACIIPAHIWTPWFSVLGSKSGFDSIDECFGDLSDQIFALETGLSSDPLMNRQCTMLDRFTLVSNSDAHSPENLGREANLFDTEMSYIGILNAMKKKNGGFIGTIEFFPGEGKYFLDGHRKCGICWEPSETKKHNGICPVCGKKVTVGVLNRVSEFAEISVDRVCINPPFFTITPLKNVIAEVLNIGAVTRKVAAVYDGLLCSCGSELSILLDIPIEEIQKINSRVAEGVRRLRNGNVQIENGYDGVFGRVRIF